MKQKTSPPPTTARLVLWSVAAEPLFLAALALLLNRLGALPRDGAPPNGDVMLIVFSALSLGALWAGFRFAAGGFAPKRPSFSPEPAMPPFGHQIIAVALAAVPGMLGFVHHLLYGMDWVLLAFCLGGFAAAARHALFFGRGPE